VRHPRGGMEKLSKFHVLVALTCAYAAFLFYLSSLPSPPQPLDWQFLYKFAALLEDWGVSFLVYPFYVAYKHPDKFAHAILYMGFGLLLHFTLRARNSVPRAAALSILIGAFYGATDEFHQSFVPYRSPDIMDLLADIVGLLLAQLLIFTYLSIKRMRG